MQKSSTVVGDSEKQEKDSISEPPKEVKLTILVCNGDSSQNPESTETKDAQKQKQIESTKEEVKVTILVCNGGDSNSSQTDDELGRKVSLSRNTSSREQCRVCLQEKEEGLIELGCQCRGGLAKSHRSCIDAWFRTKGSNKCEICQALATNVTPPETQPSSNYWVWRIDPRYRQEGRQRGGGCFSPLWVAFSILIGGLMLDVLISITLGVSALPVNIIVGVIVVLGLVTAVRLTLEFCYEWRLRRAVHRAESNFTHIAYPPAL